MWSTSEDVICIKWTTNYLIPVEAFLWIHWWDAGKLILTPLNMALVQNCWKRQQQKRVVRVGQDLGNIICQYQLSPLRAGHLWEGHWTSSLVAATMHGHSQLSTWVYTFDKESQGFNSPCSEINTITKGLYIWRAVSISHHILYSNEERGSRQSHVCFLLYLENLFPKGHFRTPLPAAACECNIHLQSKQGGVGRYRGEHGEEENRRCQGPAKTAALVYVFHTGTTGDCHQDLWSCDNEESESTSEKEEMKQNPSSFTQTDQFVISFSS